jgi:F420-dependent oxidoreductase-like protein
MKLGLQIIRFDCPGPIGPTLALIARAADAGGFASLWVMDHFFQIGFSGPAEDPMLEGYVTAGFLAGVTRQISLGLLVSGVHHRPPGLLMKTVTTLDVLSGGRTYLGLGAGWFERESHGLGLGFPPLAERYGQLEETLQLAHQMWADDARPFAGRHYHLAEPLCRPQPLRRPPILIGGEGERKTLRLVAQYADACNLWVGRDRELLASADMITHKLAVLRGHCNDVGRDADQIEVTVLTTQSFGPAGLSLPEFIDGCARLAAVGVDHVIVNTPDVHTLEAVQALSAQVIPALGSLSSTDSVDPSSLVLR